MQDFVENSKKFQTFSPYCGTKLQLVGTMNVLSDEILKNVGEFVAQEIESFIIESEKEVWVDMQRCEPFDQGW